MPNIHFDLAGEFGADHLTTGRVGDVLHNLHDVSLGKPRPRPLRRPETRAGIDRPVRCRLGQRGQRRSARPGRYGSGLGVPTHEEVLNPCAGESIGDECRCPPPDRQR